MNITGTMYIYKSQQYGGYSTYVTNQDKEKMYISVGFKKDNEPTEDKLKIEVTKAFFTFYKTKQGMSKPKIVVMEYTKEQQDDFMNVPLDSSDLPF